MSLPLRLQDAKWHEASTWAEKKVRAATWHLSLAFLIEVFWLFKLKTIFFFMCSFTQFPHHSVTNMPSTDWSESSEKVSLCAQCRNVHVWLAGFCELIFDPVYCSTTEGVRRLFSGATMASSRGALVTVGQVSSLFAAGSHFHCTQPNLLLLLLLKDGNTKVVEDREAEGSTTFWSLRLMIGDY